jgi:hypothetical protein
MVWERPSVGGLDFVWISRVRVEERELSLWARLHGGADICIGKAFTIL